MAANGTGAHGYSAIFNFAKGAVDERLQTLLKEFDGPAACVIKHHNPCGCALGDTLFEAFVDAHAGDPLSAFGGVIGFNREVDAKTAAEIAGPDRFVEAVVAPAFSLWPAGPL